MSDDDGIIPRETVLLNAIHALRYRAGMESRKDQRIYGNYVRELRDSADLLEREMRRLLKPIPEPQQSLRA